MKDENHTNAYRRLIDIGIALSSEKHLESLLQHILLEAKDLANADGGTMYLYTENDTLKFSILINDTLGIAQGGKTGQAITLPDIQMYLDDNTPNMSNVASCVAHRGTTIVVDDARASEEFDFSGTLKFDEMLEYRSTSFLTIPFKSQTDRCIGVLQLLNAQTDDGEVVPFSADVVPLIEALASQASIAIENRALLDGQDLLKRQLEKEVDNRTKELKEALTKLSEAHIILKELNTIDAVTGIRNRQYFDNVLEAEWRRAKRQGYDVSLMLLDIDHFKKVNDTHGHLAGDECLASIAKEIDKAFNRPSDVVARYGGEEFAVILPYVTEENALSMAEQLRKLIEERTFLADGNQLKITISIGLATLQPSDDVAPRDLIGLADGVLYEAKSTGRNRVCTYSQSG